MCPNMENKAIDPLCKIMISYGFQPVGIFVPAHWNLRECLSTNDSFAIDLTAMDGIHNIIGLILVDRIQPEFSHWDVCIFEMLQSI